MTPEQHRRVRDLFEAIIEESPSNRAAWLDHNAGDDVFVRDEVQSLLEHEDRAGAFLDAPVLDRVPELLADEGLAPGDVVRSYTIIRELGRGGMGRVYLASDDRLGRTVALKALAPQLTRDEAHRDRLRREARAAAGLTHPGICAVYALEEIDGELYIATEFINGRTLRDEIGSGRRPAFASLLRTARDLASALASAHDRGIAHRDLKPENIMRATDGRLKILDFGLAQSSVPPLSAAATSVTTPGMLVGTPGYMAPEQLQGQPADRRADVFAMGVLLYELAAGVRPFEAESPLATLARVLDGEPRPLSTMCPTLPAGFAHVIERCLRKAPSDRFQSAAEVLGALDLIDIAPSPVSNAAWWRVHQVAMIAIYALTAALGWLLKEWSAAPTSTPLFMALGIGSTIASVLRGHTLFTARVNPSMLAGERQRTARPLLAVDLLLALALTVDGFWLVAHPVTAMLTIALALGIALAATVIEPATNRAAFGGRSPV